MTLPSKLTTNSIRHVNREVFKAGMQPTSAELKASLEKQKRATEEVPVLDLSGDADQTPAQQLANIEYVSTPQRAADIAAMFRSSNSINSVIDTYGHCDLKQSMDFPSSTDMDHMYRDIFKVDTGDANTNQFLRLEELYSAITGSGISGNVNSDSPQGLFTDINEPTMSALYDIVYGQPMNYSDYEAYLQTGNSNIYTAMDQGQLTNDMADGSHLAKFNRLVPHIERYAEVAPKYDTDSDYRTVTSTSKVPGSQPVNPKISNSAPAMGFNEIDWVLQIGTGVKMPAEAATYLTSININHNRNLAFPKGEGRRFINELKHEHRPFRLHMGECTLQVLKHVISHADLTYGQMPKGSLIYLINDTALQDDHPGIYEFVRKVILDLYSLDYGFRHAFKRDSQYRAHNYMSYMTYRDLVNLRINLNFLKEWSSHYWEYCDFIEIWEDLDQAVGFMLPYIISILNSTDVRYGNHYFNDNQNNNNDVDNDTGEFYD